MPVMRTLHLSHAGQMSRTRPALTGVYVLLQASMYSGVQTLINDMFKVILALIIQPE